MPKNLMLRASYTFGAVVMGLTCIRLNLTPELLWQGWITAMGTGILAAIAVSIK